MADLKPNPRFRKLASDKAVAKTKKALEANGFTVFVVKSGQQAYQKALELIPEGAEIMTMTSMTLEAIGLPKLLNESGKYNSIRAKLMKMDRATQGHEMRKLAAAPDYVIGSVHAVTQDGHVYIASNTGSQLSTYAYTGGKVIWVVGTQKIVADDDEAIKRIYEYSYPLEDQRFRKTYSSDKGSFVSKILAIKKEVSPGRLTLILTQENLGF